VVAEGPERRQVSPSVVEVKSLYHCFRVLITHEKPKINDPSNGFVSDVRSIADCFLDGVEST
jgi:hypothetical protein